jgi:hypothetical protein
VILLEESMRNGLSNFGCVSSLLLGALLSASGISGAQSQTLPDAQVEANVLKAFANAPQLANQSITTTTVYGTVTLSGSVTDEASRTLAETLASRAMGVQKVVDELALGTQSAQGDTGAGGGTENAVPPPPPASSPDWGPAGPPPDVANGQATAGAGSQPQLQSDGTMAPPPPPPSGGSASANPSYPQQYPAPQANGSAYPPQGGGQYPQQGQQPYPNGYPQQGSYPQQGPYPQQGAYPQPGAYPQQAPQAGYAQQQAPPPYGAQVAGKPVTIPNGALVRIRLNQSLDTKHTAPGTVFDATVLNDVAADGEVAIPRGASVQGTVVDSKSSGSVGGKGVISLKLTQVTLSGKVYPIVSDQWSHDGRDKTGQTVGSAVGMGAFGALIGAVAGGGPGAAIGAAAGGIAGVGASAASGTAKVVIPAEAILTFHLVQPAPVATVSQAEMDRLGASVRPGQMQRRYPPPPPPGYYPRPYPYGY